MGDKRKWVFAAAVLASFIYSCAMRRAATAHIPSDLRDAVADAPFSAAERALIKECGDNVRHDGPRSPETAVRCAEAFSEGAPEPLVNRFSEDDPAMAGLILGRNNALIDLKKIVSTQKGRGAVIALERMWNVPSGPAKPADWRPADCALCDMGLGPKPEHISDWLGRYSPEDRAAIEYAFRLWDSLGPVRQKSLSGGKYQRTRENWDAEGARRRFAYLGMWAGLECEKAAAAAETLAISPPDRTKLETLASIFSDDLEVAGISDLSCVERIRSALNSAPVGDGRGSVPPQEKKTAGLAAAKGRTAGLSGKSVEDQRSGLGGLFDNSAGGAEPTAAGSGAAALASRGTPAPQQLTLKQVDELGSRMLRMEDGKIKGDLAEVMRQTAAGRRALAFYEDPAYAKAGTNRLDFGFDLDRGYLGVWRPDTRQLRLNLTAAEEFAEARGTTLPRLIKDPAGMKALAAYLSPIMVHEAEHQNQTARAAAAGVDWVKYGSGPGKSSPYTRAMENLSNKEGTEHAIEYCRKHGGAACLAGMNTVVREDIRKFMEDGLSGLDASKAPVYSHIDGYEGGVSREFREAQLRAFQLNTLETLKRGHPELMTPKRESELKELRELMNTRFKWYLQTRRELQEAEREALEFRRKYADSLSMAPSPL
ncbi:MAG: hypothetical protein M0011_00170 [Elusimicrobia bacterium]|nr:hypothetical protein [Elusimicrobiota bacterium]